MIGVGLAHPIDNHGDDQVVGDERTPIHVALGLAAKLGIALPMAAQQIAAGDVRYAVLASNPPRLSAFTRPNRPEEDQIEVVTGQ
jgi:hypothetical protein